MSTNFNIFAIKHNDVLPTRGSVLISEPFMKDIYFQRAGVLLVEHNMDGSMGFVLNKKTDFLLNDFFPEMENLPRIPIFLGGPVHSNRLFFIHTLGEDILPGSMRLNDQLFFDGKFEVLQEFMKSGPSILNYVKFFLGYAGWTEGQLKNEIKGNSWLVSQDISTTEIMEAHDEVFWKQSLEHLGSKYKTWSKFPIDPDLN